MHEVAVITEIIDIVNENINTYNLERVNKIVLNIGEFTCIDENALRFAFEAIDKATVYKHAELVVEKIKASAYCDRCKQNFSISSTNKCCPNCNTYSSNVITGYELLVERIEGE